MAKKNRFVTIMAFLALFGIIIGIVGTGILIIFSDGNNTPSEQTLTPEQYAELQEMINTNSGSVIKTGTGETGTGEIK